MGYNVSHFFFDNGCSSILCTCPVVSEKIVKIIGFRSCDVLNPLNTASPPGAAYLQLEGS